MQIAAVPPIAPPTMAAILVLVCEAVLLSEVMFIEDAPESIKIKVRKRQSSK
jgi:hypothetical protein